MPATILDSAVFRDIFTTEAMRKVFSDENRVQKYLDFEAALARAQSKLGIIPKEAAAEIGRHCSADKIDMAKLKEATERIGYPVLPVVQQLVKLCKDGLGEWSHWGATTQDITDTATVMQIREGLAIIEKGIDGICDGLAALAKKYRDTPMAGRSNLQQAVPITFGYKMATMLAAFERHNQRLKEIRPRVLVRVLVSWVASGVWRASSAISRDIHATCFIAYSFARLTRNSSRSATPASPPRRRRFPNAAPAGGGPAPRPGSRG